MTERELARGALGSLEAVTAFNAPVFQSYAEITAMVRQHLGVDAATLFAKPIITGDEIVWSTDLTGQLRGWAELSSAERDALDPARQALGGSLMELVNSLRRRGLNTRSGNLSHLIETALVVPGVEHLHMVGDRPVLTFWGFRRLGEQGLDPLGTEPLIRTPPPAPPPLVVHRRRIWPWMVLLGLLALLLAGSGFYWWMHPQPIPPVPRPEPAIEPVKPPPPPVVPIPPPAPPIAEPKLPEPPAPEPPAPAPPVPAPPVPAPAPVVDPAPPHVDLPKQRWEQRDLSVLEGCWTLGKEFRVQSYNIFNMPTEAGITRAGRLCLDRSGRGRETSVSDFPSGRVRCDAPVTASFGSNGDLAIRRPNVVCEPARMNWMAANLSCARRDDSVAICTETTEHGHVTVEFRRGQ